VSRASGDQTVEPDMIDKRPISGFDISIRSQNEQ
jgi:hypothetical protein